MPRGRKKSVDEAVLAEEAAPVTVHSAYMSEPDPEHIVVADATSEVLLSTKDRSEASNLVNFIRRGGGSVTVFMSTGI